MFEYRQLAHMEPIRKNEEINGTTADYLPHHAVINENSLMTKIFFVFDASCKTSSVISLND